MLDNALCEELSSEVHSNNTNSRENHFYPRLGATFITRCPFVILKSGFRHFVQHKLSNITYVGQLMLDKLKYMIFATRVIAWDPRLCRTDVCVVGTSSGHRFLVLPTTGKPNQTVQQSQPLVGQISPSQFVSTEGTLNSDPPFWFASLQVWRYACGSYFCLLHSLREQTKMIIPMLVQTPQFVLWCLTGNNIFNW